MKSIYYWFVLIVSIAVLVSSCSSREDILHDTTAPVIAEVTFVTTPTNDSTPNYTFSSDEAGTIIYGGSCSSSTTSATTGNNTITLVSLNDGTYSNCTITVTDNLSNSVTLNISSFIVDTTAPTLSEVTAVSTPTNDNTSSYTFFSTLPGTITYGVCSGSPDNASADNNTITFDALAEGTYDNCTISVTDAINSNTSDNLSVSSFTIDITTPTLSSVTIASNNSVSTLAKTGNIITLSITSAEAIQTPSVSIAGQTATVTGDNMTWSAAYTMTNSNTEGSVSLNIGFSDLAGNAGDNVTSTTNGSAVLFDRTSPVLQPVDNVTTPTSDNTSSYTFSSTEAGTITYGVCSGSPDNASAGNNTITFDALADGTHSNCKISVTDNASNTSDNLSVRSFTIGAITPALVEVTPVTTPDNDTTPSYTFFSTLSGTITYGGDCDGDNYGTAEAGNNTIIFDVLAEGLHNNCEITVDNNSKTSDNLSVSSFTIDTTAPTLNQVTPVPTPDNDSTPNYTFYSTEAGAITYGGSCSSSSDNNTTTEADNITTVTFNALADGTYDNCTISVTDNTSNTSDNLTVSEFTIGAIKPVLVQVTAVAPNPTNVNTPSYTFFSTLSGTIGYGGSCSSSSNDNLSAAMDNNTIIFNPLAEGTYDNCTISVTSSGGVASDNLSVSSFTIDITAPTLAETTLVPSLTNDNVTQYTFSSTEGGTFTIGGHCSNGSDNNTVVADNMTVSFAALPDATYSNCTITVTDSAGNSVTIDVNSFTIDTTAPTLSQVTGVSTPTNDNTSSYTFSSNEAGIITYGGSCSSSSNDNISVDGDNNTITFNALPDGTYSNCTIRVSDNASNTSSPLSVTQFIIDTTAPTVSSTSPTDNQSSVSVSENISVTFSESMDNTSVTTNTSNTTCSGYSFQVSSDSFSSCVQMGSSPTVSNSNRTFTVAPSLKMFYSATYKIRVTTAAKDSAGNYIASQYTQTYGFKTTSTIPITAGSAYSCFMLDNGSVKCWGENNLGQLGLGDIIIRGDNSSDMGDNLTIVDLGSGRTATSITTGTGYTCVLLDDDSVKCWGWADFGQLGAGKTDEYDEPPDLKIPLGTGITAIASGYFHTCAILDNSSIKCWG